MAVVQHVYKRGSVYWWRRRLPNGIGSHASLLIEISLRTKFLAQAKLLAAEVTLASERLIQDLRRKMIEPEKAKQILVNVAKKHSAKLDAVAAAELAFGSDPEDGRLNDVIAGWANRILSGQGIAARVGDPEIREMRSAGLDATMIDAVANQIDFYKIEGIYPPSTARIEGLLQDLDIPNTRVNYQQAEQLYLRGLSAALLDTKRRWMGMRPDDDALLQAALIADAAAIQVTAVVPQTSKLSPDSEVRQIPSQEDDFDLDDEIDDDDDLEEPTRGLVEIVEQAAAQKVKAEDWGEKTGKQHVALAKLFVRFVGHDNPAKMRQSHISDFKITLSNMPKNYGKSPQDHILPLVDILARAKDLPPEQVGLAQGTLNRHMTQIGNIASICKHAGFPFGNYEGVSGLRSKKKGSGRGERGRFATDELRLLFDLPIWNGCKGEDDRLSPGDLTFHDARYWVPMLAMYHGPRREEYCGLLVSEIEPEAEIPAIRIEPNFIRGLKNPESKRRIPIHPELIRLGFLDYVAALQAIGHVLLFPELKAAAASTPMGDVFDQSWQEMRLAAIPSAKEDGKVLHSLRHWCNNEMKQAGVAAEIRKDILGHTNGDTNEGRYSDVARLRVMAIALAQLPQPSAHVSPVPIRLIERVEKHLAPPTKAKKVAS